jgi:molecular chaperone GrpE (heat shock protein)
LIFCVAAGAFSFLIPFRSQLKIAEAENAFSAVEKIKNIEQIAAQISSATNLWQAVQEESAKAAKAANAVSARMSEEARQFAEFMAKANDSEKAHLRLEVDKLKRSESEWLQVITRTLDHVYALHQGASQSGQPRLIEQISNFQNACRDSARRIGLVPFVASPDEAFDPAKHQLIDDKEQPKDGAVIVQTLATGFTFQGQLLRPALVRLHSDKAATSAELKEKKANKPETAELPL